MPPRKKQSPKDKASRLQIPADEKERSNGFGVRFVNLHLLADDKQRLSELAEEQHDFVDIIATWVENGYKFSLSPDRDHATMTAAITGKTCIEENVGLCMTAKHAEPFLAVLCLWYKHQYLCYEGVFPSNDERRRMSGGFE